MTNLEAGVYVLLNLSQYDEHLSISFFSGWFLCNCESTYHNYSKIRAIAIFHDTCQFMFNKFENNNHELQITYFTSLLEYINLEV
jgi:hypothetical protein